MPCCHGTCSEAAADMPGGSSGSAALLCKYMLALAYLSQGMKHTILQELTTLLRTVSSCGWQQSSLRCTQWA
jgi:hypothetical protein